MVFSDVIREGQKLAMCAILASNLGLAADAADPFIATSRLVTTPARFQTLESSGVDILAPPKQPTEERDFRLLRRLVGHRCQRDRLGWRLPHVQGRCPLRSSPKLC